MLVFGSGLLLFLSGNVLGQPAAMKPAWQSLQIEQTVPAIFPRELLRWGITHGQADIAIATNAEGRLEDLLPVAYSRPEFADAAVAAIKRWNFKPARLNGEPIGTTVQLHFYFTVQGAVVSSVTINDIMELELARLFAGRYAYRICPSDRLDRVPVPISTVVPKYPLRLEQDGVKGTVTVEFYIDETGRVRLPTVVSRNDNALLDWLAVDALTRWKFAPPTSRGRAVLVKASQQFVFGGGS